MTIALRKFAYDIVESGIAAAAAAVLALNLDAASAKVVAYAALAGFIAGAISAARRFLATKFASP